ncbi:polysaccharide deacetylase family protein, partial [Acinetobacter baumannii]
AMRAVFCYHKVGPEAEEGRYLNIDPENLRSHIRFFKRRNIPLIAAKDIPTTTGSFACLTFDDCYTSTLTYGLDVLQSEGVTATLYAVS